MLQTKKNLYATALVARLSMELASQTILYRKNPAPSSRANYSLLFFIFFFSCAARRLLIRLFAEEEKKEPKSSRAEGSCRAVWWSCDEVCFFRLLRVWLTPVELVVFFFFLFRSLLLRSKLLREPSAIFPFIHLFTFHRRDMLAAEKHVKTSLGSSHDAIAADNFVRASSSSSRPLLLLLSVPHLSPLVRFDCLIVACYTRKKINSSLNLHHPRCASWCTEREAFQRAILHNTSHTMCCAVIFSFRYYFILFIFRISRISWGCIIDRERLWQRRALCNEKKNCIELLSVVSHFFLVRSK